jgi:hypothetical protein
MEPLDIDDDDGIIAYALKNNCSRETYDLLLKRLPDSVKKIHFFSFSIDLF